MKRRIILQSAATAMLGLGAAMASDPVSGRLTLLLRGNPVPVSQASVAQGRAVFAEHCAVCHGDRGDGRGALAAELTTQPADFGALNRPPSVLAMRIHYGVGQDMPAWRGVLDDKTIWHLVNYVESLALRGQGRGERWWRPG